MGEITKKNGAFDGKIKGKIHDLLVNKNTEVSIAGKKPDGVHPEHQKWTKDFPLQWLTYGKRAYFKIYHACITSSHILNDVNQRCGFSAAIMFTNTMLKFWVFHPIDILFVFNILGLSEHKENVNWISIIRIKWNYQQANSWFLIQLHNTAWSNGTVQYEGRGTPKTTTFHHFADLWCFANLKDSERTVFLLADHQLS